jgi:hypothetical protein
MGMRMPETCWALSKLQVINLWSCCILLVDSVDSSSLMFCWLCIVIYPYNMNQKIHYFLLIYLNSRPLHVSSSLAAHHQEDQLCINSNWYSQAFMLTGCWQQPVNTTHYYTNCCLYRVDPPDDEQQACSKHVEPYYWNKLKVNSACSWFMLYVDFILYMFVRADS